MTFRSQLLLTLAGISLLNLLSTPVFAEPRWQIIPSASLLVSYDDNLFFRKDREEDILTRPGVRITPHYEGPALSLIGNYGLQMETFANHPEENRISQEGGLQADLSRGFQRWVKSGDLTMNEDFIYTSSLQDYYFDERRQQVGNLSNYGIRTQRTESFRNAFSLAISFPMTPRWTLQSRYGNLLTEYPKDPLLIDNVTNSLMIGTSYAGIKATPYAEIESSLIRWGTKDSYNHRLSLGSRHTISQEWKMNFHAGMLLVDSEDEEIRKTWNAGLSFSRQTRYHAISMGYSRSINPAAGIGEHPPIAQLFYANWTAVISQKATTSLGGNYAVNSSLSGANVDSRSYSVSAGIDYRVIQWLQANLSASHFNQDSSIQFAESLRREIVSLSLTGTWE